MIALALQMKYLSDRKILFTTHPTDLHRGYFTNLLFSLLSVAQVSKNEIADH